MPWEHVDGEDKGKIVLFALSTCQWCKKTRLLLEELKVDFNYIYVDLLAGEERNQIVEEVKKYNPQLSFPTIVIGEEKTIVGFNEEGIREALE
ncbi:MAG TPA: glutaredoxin family protein [Methanobacterium sp.]